MRELHALAIKQFACPGDPSWPLGTLFPAAANRTEAGMFLCIMSKLFRCHSFVHFTSLIDQFKQYFKQARDELGIRLVALVFEDGTKSKWWQVCIFF